VLDDAGTPPPEVVGESPRAPLGHLSRLGFALRSAADIDEVARSVLLDLVTLPDVGRVGLGLTEGAGRRLRFVHRDAPTSDASGADPDDSSDDSSDDDAALAWWHIDAYDELPLTTVVRTGDPILGSLEELEARYPEIVARMRKGSTRAMAAWPLPGTGSPVGGIVVFYDAPQAFGEPQRRLLEATARRVSEAVRRVRMVAGRGPGDVAPDDPTLIGDGEHVRLLLEGDPRASGAARRFLREQLDRWEVDEDTSDSAQLCLSELVTNAVIHARTSSELTVQLEGRLLTVVVRDLGGSNRAADPSRHLPIPDDEDPLRVFGRGLTLVDALADRWGSERDSSGTTAWFALELDQPQASSSRTG
jgi:anti-sigma regulatory factor (Ser/Thr protein kinase)